MKCARCDHHADDLSQHAAESGHLLCIVCRRRSLTDFEPQTCAACIGAVRADLADLATGWTLLEPVDVNALTLLGDGTMQRHMHNYELTEPLVHPLSHDDEMPRLKRVRDEWPSDPLPVVAALASWEDFWRADYGDPTGPPATLHGVVGYLTANLDTGHRAAQTHPAFDEFAAEVRHLRQQVHFAAGLADVPVSAPASCFDCGGELLRTYTEPRTSAAGAARRKALAAYIAQASVDAQAARRAARSPLPILQTRHDAARMLVEARRGTAGEGLTDAWTCAWCRREYDQPGYFLALRAAASSWVPVPLAAETARRSVRTVRSWITRGLVTAACRVVDRAVLVWWPDVSDRAFRHADDAQSRRTA